MDMGRTPAVLQEVRMAERVQRVVVRLGRPWGEEGGRASLGGLHV